MLERDPQVVEDGDQVLGLGSQTENAAATKDAGFEIEFAGLLELLLQCFGDRRPVTQRVVEVLDELSLEGVLGLESADRSGDQLHAGGEAGHRPGDLGEIAQGDVAVDGVLGELADPDTERTDDPAERAEILGGVAGHVGQHDARLVGDVAHVAERLVDVLIPSVTWRRA